MSTHPVQKYLTYLQTDELVRVIQRGVDKLSTEGLTMAPAHRRVLELATRDAIEELHSRQMTLFDDETLAQAPADRGLRRGE